MNTITLTINDQSLSELKKEARITQKRGLPFFKSKCK